MFAESMLVLGVVTLVGGLIGGRLADVPFWKSLLAAGSMIAAYALLLAFLPNRSWITTAIVLAVVVVTVVALLRLATSQMFLLALGCIGGAMVGALAAIAVV